MTHALIQRSIVLVATPLLLAGLLPSCSESGPDGAGDGSKVVVVAECAAFGLTLSADPTTGTAPLKVQFVVTISGADGQVDLKWDPGPVSTTIKVNDPQPVISYHAGDYTATVTATYQGASCSASVDIHVLCAAGSTSCKGGDAVVCQDGAYVVTETCGADKQCKSGQCVDAVSCALQNCTAEGFSYTCGTGNKQVSNNYGGPGPDGLSSYVVSYSNGHKVTCTYTSSSSGHCNDDTSASCTF